VLKSRFDARARLPIIGLAACLITTSIALAAPTPAAGQTETAGVTMAGAGGSERVAYGDRVRLSGVVEAGRTVRLEQVRSGEGWQPVAQTTAGTDGRYAFSVRPRQSGSYRAVTESGAATSPRRVTVVARLAGHSRRHVLGSGVVRVTGTLIPRLAGRPVRLERRSRGGWRLVARTRTTAGGRFQARFRPNAAGAYVLRVRFAGDSRHAAGTDTLPRVFVYRAGHASWYGPGFYGNRTACGQTLTAGVRGVAHKYLPCGTRVRFYYRGRTVTATVIDRGPYAAGREWDLAPATKQALGFGSTGTVWSTR
jgi:hypothetical protein